MLIKRNLLTDIGDGYSIQLIEQEERSWLRLNSSGRLLAFWSSREGDPKALSFSAVVDILRDHLVAFHEGRLSSLDDAIEFWPGGWEYWGRGIPAPLLDLVETPDFVDLLSCCPIERI